MRGLFLPLSIVVLTLPLYGTGPIPMCIQQGNQLLCDGTVYVTQGMQVNGTTTLSAINTTNINGSFPNPNILINGGFEFWQRSSSTTAPANGAYVADRWKVETAEVTGVTISTDTTTKDNGTYSAKVIVTSASGGNNWRLSQAIENYAAYAGKTITFSARIYTVTANAIRLRIDDNVTATNSSAYHTGSGWETLSLTFNVSSSASQLVVYVGMIANGDKKVGTYYFDSGMLVVGNQPITFIPDNYQSELAKCQRYYEKSYPLASPPGSPVSTDAYWMPATLQGANTPEGSVVYKVKKRINPTVTLYTYTTGVSGSWTWRTVLGVDTDRASTVDQGGTNGFNVRQAVSTEPSALGHWTADAEM